MKITAVIYIFFGVLFILNFAIAGPHGFAGRWSAVILGSAAGLALIVCGYQMWRSQRRKR